ncbi:MAG: hypothetical protein J2P21_09995 [Chloracidobacterium sp.]|nr:hypothetical protein [Chloracidobacterium sp.]
MRPTLKKIIMSVFAIILLPGVSNITADAQHRYWRHLRRSGRVIVQPYSPVYKFPVYASSLWPAILAEGYKEGRDVGKKDDAEDSNPPNLIIHNDGFYLSFSPVYRQTLKWFYDEHRRR